MPAAPSMGVLAHLGMKADATATPATADEEYEFLSESLAASRQIVRTRGMRGGRLNPVERLRVGQLSIGGTISMQPTYAELVALLPRIIGTVSPQSGYNDYSLSDTVVPVAFQVVADRLAKVFTYTGCKVARATFKSGKGQALSLDLDIEALEQSIGNANTFPSLTVSATPPFVFTDSVLTLGGTAYQVEECEITIDWSLKTDRFMNSLTRTDLPSMDCTVTTKFMVPYTSDTTGLYDGGGSVAGVTGNINFAYLGAGGGASGVNLKFTFGKLVFPADKNPVVGAKDEILLGLTGEAYKTGSTSPLTITLDSTT